MVLLLLCSLAVEKTIFVKKMGGLLNSKNYLFNLVKLCGFSALSSAVANNTAVVAVFMASINQNRHLVPSRFLLPLSYASILGGTLTLVGTSTNLIVSGFVSEAGLPELNMFSTTPVAIFVVATSLFAVCFAAFVLPVHNRVQHVPNSYFIETQVSFSSSLIDKTVVENGLRDLGGLYLAELIRGDVLYSPVRPDFKIQADDKLFFVGDVTELSVLDKFKGLMVLNEDLANVKNNLVEVVVTAGASITGSTIKQSNFRSAFNATVIGVRRGQQKISGGLGKVKIYPGDALLLAIGTDFNKRDNLKKNFIVLNSMPFMRSLNMSQSVLVLLGFFTVLMLATFSILSLLKGLLLLLGCCLVIKVISFSEVRHRFPFEILAIVGSALAIASAMFESGLADMLAAALLIVSQDFGVLGAFIAIYLVTLLLTELITNNAAAALVFPVSLTLAEHFNADYMPFVMAVMFGASASFLSPFGYQTNLMVYSVGNYQLKDYFIFGLPVSVIYSVTALWAIHFIYPF